MSRRAIQTRLNKLDNRPGLAGAKPCRVCGVLIDRHGGVVGPVRWIAKPPVAFEHLDQTRIITPPPQRCAGCGRITVLPIRSPLGVFAYIEEEPGEPIMRPPTIDD